MPPDRGAAVPPEPTPPILADTGSEPRRTRVLIVEDDEDTRQVLAFALGACGYEVTQSADATQALEHLKAAPFDLVLTDYDMPGMMGPQMLEVAHQQGILRGAAALIVTAHPSPEVAGSTQVLKKPVDLHTLLLQVERITRRSPSSTSE